MPSGLSLLGMLEPCDDEFAHLDFDPYESDDDQYAAAARSRGERAAADESKQAVFAEEPDVEGASAAADFPATVELTEEEERRARRREVLMCLTLSEVKSRLERLGQKATGQRKRAAIEILLDAEADEQLEQEQREEKAAEKTRSEDDTNLALWSSWHVQWPCTRTIHTSGPASHIALSEQDDSGDAVMIVASGNNLEVFRVDLSEQGDSERMFSLSGHTGIIVSLDISPDALYAVSTGHDFSVRLWFLPEQTCTILSIGTVRRYSTCVAINAEHIACGRTDGAIVIRKLIGMETSDPPAPVSRTWKTGTRHRLDCIAFTPEGESVVASGHGGSVHVFSLLGERIAMYNHEGHVSLVRASDSYIVSGGSDIRVWKRNVAEPFTVGDEELARRLQQKEMDQHVANDASQETADIARALEADSQEHNRAQRLVASLTFYDYRSTGRCSGLFLNEHDGLVLVCADRTVTVFDLSTQKIVLKLQGDEANRRQGSLMYSMAVAGDVVLVGRANNRVHMFRRTGRATKGAKKS